MARLSVTAVLIVAAFAAGYLFRTSTPIAELRLGGGEVSAQPSSPAPQPATPSPRGSPPAGQRDRGERGSVTGTVASVRDRTLVVTVTSSTRRVKVDRGATLTTQLEPGASILREIPLADLKRGAMVTLRGAMVDGKFTVRSVTVELR